MPPAGLDNLKHIVVLMMENRSFDHMLGFAQSDTWQIDGLKATKQTSIRWEEQRKSRVTLVTPATSPPILVTRSWTRSRNSMWVRKLR
jgi:phospholipase C